MRGRGAVLLVAVAILGGFLLIRELAGDGQNLAGMGGPGPLPEEEEEGALFPAGESFFSQRVVGAAASTIRAYRGALAQAEEILVRTRTREPELARARWVAAGRTDVGGRVTDLAVDPSASDTVYAATANGGLRKSTDAGVTWGRAWPPGGSQTMGAVAVSVDGTVYAGTGQPHPAAGFVLWGGTGVFRSRDGGRTWEGIGLEDAGAVARIAVDPSDPERIYVAAAGSSLRPGGERGLYRSVDGGDSWELTLPPAVSTSGAVDVAIDPNDTRHLLATMWDRDILSGRTGGPFSAVHLSTDGGDSWREVTLPGRFRDAKVGRIGVTFSRTPGRAYAVVANDPEGQPVGLWRSDDGGLTWLKTSNLDFQLGRASNAWWFGEVWADPSDADRVFVAGSALLESTDGGEEFSPNFPSGLEGGEGGADVHALAWDPAVPGRVYLGGSAGVARSLTAGEAGSWVPAVSQGWALQYTVEERSLAPQSLGSITLDPATSPAAVAFDDSDPQVAYYGGRNVNRTEDGGETWASISPDLTVLPQREPDPFAVVTAIAPPPPGTRVMYAGTSNGLVWRTPDLGRTWDPLPAVTRPSWVTRIAVDPLDPGRAWVSFSGYADQPHVVATSDAGRTWTDVTGNLPDAPVNDLVTLPGGGLVAATDLGVFISLSSEPEWLTLGSSLPAVPVLDIRYQQARRAVLAATFGEGFQRVRLPDVAL